MQRRRFNQGTVGSLWRIKYGLYNKIPTFSIGRAGSMASRKHADRACPERLYCGGENEG